MRSSTRKLNPKLKKRIAADFIGALTDLKTPEETKQFLESFFTEAEFISYAKRLSVAMMLEKNVSCAEIKKKILVSSATIAAIQEAMQKKPKGFALALEKLEAEAWAGSIAKKISSFLKERTVLKPQ